MIVQYSNYKPGMHKNKDDDNDVGEMAVLEVSEW